MIAWMLYCVIVATIVAGAARAAESLARIAGYRLRWIWLAGVLLASFLSLSSAVQRFEPSAPLTIVATTRDVAAAPSRPTWTQRLEAVASTVERTLDGSLALVARSIDRATTPSMATYAMLAWLVASLVLGAIFAIVISRFHRARRHWPLSRVQDVSVRISPSVGPIVIGLLRPEIVVPRWLLHRALDEQRLAVSHEQEHLRARDPLLLGLGWLFVILAPWSPAGWYMLSRLRLAIELDCDARVLRRGAPRRAYGSLLIEVAQNASPLTLSALGLADESSQLYQRILALRGPVASFARTRALAAGVAAATGVLVACRVSPPPASTIVAPDTSSAVQPAAAIPPASSASQPAPAVVRSTEPRITPRPARPSAPVTIVARDTVVPVPATIDTVPVLPRRDASMSVMVRLDSVAAKNAPLLLIDGIRSTMDDMHRLDPKTILNVEVLKGNAAVAEYGADAQYGIITITTKKAPPPR